eukprot:m.136124 g.136124  ORF g.136124 m.136124 type:complete len:407 (+) comp23939_c0_seq17:148-1368(+)
MNLGSIFTPLRTACRVPQVLYRTLSSFCVLGIETSFDDTGVSIVRNDGKVLSEIVLHQNHTSSGGAIPPVAAQQHRANLPTALRQCLSETKMDISDLHAIACTQGPGLALCLHEGLVFCQKIKAMHPSLAFYPVHHMEAHALTPRIEQNIPFPFLVLLASGGHCLLLLATGVGKFLNLGTCLDMPPGVAFDKLARSLHLSGGAELEKFAEQGDPSAFSFKSPLTDERSCNFSFSGPLTAALFTLYEKHLKYEQTLTVSPALPASSWSNLAASFQRVVFDHISLRVKRALHFCHSHPQLDPPTAIVVSGGVACNRALRKAITFDAALYQTKAIFPPLPLCLDNGTMIAWTAIEHILAGKQPHPDPSSLRYQPKWPLGNDTHQVVMDANITNAQANLGFVRKVGGDER